MTKCNIWYAFYILDILYNLVYYNRCKEDMNLTSIIFKKKEVNKMTKYVILKKIDNIWYATRNRYTEKELEVIVYKHYNDDVDFETLDDGDCQGLDDGVIIVKDDGRELKENAIYLNDDLKLETEENNNNFGLCLVVLFVVWLLLGVYGVMAVGLVWLVVYIINGGETKETVQNKLPENHKAKGMM